MPIPKSTTRWIAEPIVPETYESVEELVATARRARGRRVTFDWAFDREELECLRRAVFEWGTRTKGSYRVFDARVLAAINEALEEPNAVYVLSEPDQEVDCEVTCVDEEGSFYLRGHAPFDIVFGYGSAAVGDNPAISLRLGPRVEEKLAEAIGMLGWDLSRLQERTLKPVTNALYGLALDYGLDEEEIEATGPPLELSVHFQGPFSVMRGGKSECLFDAAVSDAAGIYLWTIEVEGKPWPWYVGQTRRSFGMRTAEHLAGMLSGEYRTYDSEALGRGEHLSPTAYPKGKWPYETLPAFLENLVELAPHVVETARRLRIYVALLEADGRLYNRVEGTIGRHLKEHPDARLRDFFTPGIQCPRSSPSAAPSI